MANEDSGDSLEATFSLVANDIRLDILRTLWNFYIDDPSPEPKPVPFSTLKDWVGVRDSGQFHYHLDKLVPQFVTNHEDGYTLTYAGAQIVGAGFSGVYTDTDVTLDARNIGECSNCDGTLQLRYEQGHAVINCDRCDATRIMPAPPILVEAHDVEANPELFGTFNMLQLQQMKQGFCYLCSGPVEVAVTDSSLEHETTTSGGVKIAYKCTACGAPFYTDATMAVFDHPVIVSQLHDVGVDYREIPPWELMKTLNTEECVRNDDPVRVDVTATIGDDELTLVLDENLDVVKYSRA